MRREGERGKWKKEGGREIRTNNTNSKKGGEFIDIFGEKGGNLFERRKKIRKKGKREREGGGDIFVLV